MLAHIAHWVSGCHARVPQVLCTLGAKVLRCQSARVPQYLRFMCKGARALRCKGGAWVLGCQSAKVLLALWVPRCGATVSRCQGAWIFYVSKGGGVLVQCRMLALFRFQGVKRCCVYFCGHVGANVSRCEGARVPWLPWCTCRGQCVVPGWRGARMPRFHVCIVCVRWGARAARVPCMGTVRCRCGARMHIGGNGHGHGACVLWRGAIGCHCQGAMASCAHATVGARVLRRTGCCGSRVPGAMVSFSAIWSLCRYAHIIHSLFM